MFVTSFILKVRLTRSNHLLIWILEENTSERKGVSMSIHPEAVLPMVMDKTHDKDKLLLEIKQFWKLTNSIFISISQSCLKSVTKLCQSCSAVKNRLIDHITVVLADIKGQHWFASVSMNSCEVLLDYAVAESRILFWHLVNFSVWMPKPLP